MLFLGRYGVSGTTWWAAIKVIRVGTLQEGKTRVGTESLNHCGSLPYRIGEEEGAAAISRVKIPFRRPAHPLVPGTAELERPLADHRSTLLSCHPRMEQGKRAVPESVG